MRWWRCRRPEQEGRGARKCDLPRGHEEPCHYTASNGHARGKRPRTVSLPLELDRQLEQLAKSSGESVSSVVARLIRLGMRHDSDDAADDQRHDPTDKPTMVA